MLHLHTTPAPTCLPCGSTKPHLVLSSIVSHLPVAKTQSSTLPGPCQCCGRTCTRWLMWRERGCVLCSSQQATGYSHARADSKRKGDKDKVTRHRSCPWACRLCVATQRTHWSGCVEWLLPVLTMYVCNCSAGTGPPGHGDQGAMLLHVCAARVDPASLCDTHSCNCGAVVVLLYWEAQGR